MENKEYIITLCGADYISAMELLYDTSWFIRFYPDGGIKKLTRYIEGTAPLTYDYLQDTPRNQHAILEDLQAEWRKHINNPSYRIPLKRVPAGWR